MLAGAAATWAPWSRAQSARPYRVAYLALSGGDDAGYNSLFVARQCGPTDYGRGGKSGTVMTTGLPVRGSKRVTVIRTSPLQLAPEHPSPPFP